MNQEEWDKYFLRLAREAGSNSKCLSRKIGALLVQGKRIVATGYNGPPEGIFHCDSNAAFARAFDTGKEIVLQESYVQKDDTSVHFLVDVGENWKPLVGDCPRKLAGISKGEGLEYCPAVHAELNVLLTAGRYGTPTEGGTLVCYCPPPCKDCIKAIIQAGIKTIVCLTGPFYDSMSEYLLEGSGIKLRQYAKGEILE